MTSVERFSIVYALKQQRRVCMKKQFDGKFYTDTFDQEIINFIEKNLPVSDTNWKNRTKGCVYLKYSQYNKVFWFSGSIDPDFKYLTKQQFKEKIGMANKQFTKDMLVAGKHVVEYRSGERRLILEAQGVVGCAGLNNYRDDLSNYNDCLINTYDRNTYDNGATIMKVYTLSNVYHFTELLKDSNLTLIWQREEKSEAQIKLEQLEEQQRKLADEIAAVRKSL